MRLVADCERSYLLRAGCDFDTGQGGTGELGVAPEVAGIPRTTPGILWGNRALANRSGID